MIFKHAELVQHVGNMIKGKFVRPLMSDTRDIVKSEMRKMLIRNTGNDDQTEVVSMTFTFNRLDDQFLGTYTEFEQSYFFRLCERRGPYHGDTRVLLVSENNNAVYNRSLEHQQKIVDRSTRKVLKAESLRDMLLELRLAGERTCGVVYFIINDKAERSISTY